MNRRSLAEIALTGARRRVREVSVLLLVAASALTAVAFVFERHETASTAWHSYAGELGGLPIIVPLAIALVAAAAARFGFLWGVLAGVLAPLASLAVVTFVALQHILQDVRSNGDAPFVGLAAMAIFGVALAILDVVLPVVERRRLEAEDPVFPTARVVRR